MYNDEEQEYDSTLWNGPRVCCLHQAFGQNYRPKEEQTDVMRVLRTDICFAVLKATLLAIRGTRGSLFQKKTDYNRVALDCERGEE